MAALRLLLFAVLTWLVGGQYPDECTTQDCDLTAQYMLQSMDLTTEPCDDFYQYACGSWIRDNPTQDGEISVDHYENLRANNDRFIKGFMANNQSRMEYSKIKTIIKTFDYYESCTDVNTINNRSVKPIITLLRDNEILVDKNWDETNWSLEDVLVGLLEDLGTKALFELNVELGMTNNSFYFISVKQPTKFSVPKKTSKQSPNSAHPAKKKNKAFNKFMRHLFQELGTGTSGKERRRVHRFEERLAKIALDESDIDYNKMKLSEVEKELGTAPIDWMYILQQVLPAAKVDSDTVIIMNGLNYFKNLTKLIRAESTRTLANYLMWKVVYDLHLKLGQRFWTIHGNYKTSIGENWSQADREDICMEELSSLKGFALPLTRVFVDKKFKGGSIKWIVNATDRMRNEFISNLQGNSWMDKSTYCNAKAKAMSLKEIIGYPVFIMNDTALDNEYRDVNVDKATYFENYLSLLKFWTKKQYSYIGKSRDDGRWSMSPLDINAQYEDSYNRMVFPVSILQPPFYSGKYTSAVNFGGVGTVIGHELTHGFDDSGKNYDHHGRRKNWWSKATLDEFLKKSQCLEKQYSAFTFHRLNVDGKRSLSENIADNGGIKLALTAYRSWEYDNGYEDVLPRMNLTNEQIFFVSFAQNWCASYSSAGIKQEMTSNYSPAPIRVNGSLKNLVDFANAFNCTRGTPMNPHKKCGLW